MSITTIYPTNKIAMHQDLALAMFLLHGLVITREIDREFFHWRYHMPWSLKYSSEEAHDTAVVAYVTSAPVHIQRMHKFASQGIGSMPTELVGTIAGQTPEEQWFILQQLDLEDDKRKALWLCFSRFYGVTRSVTYN